MRADIYRVTVIGVSLLQMNFIISSRRGLQYTCNNTVLLDLQDLHSVVLYMVTQQAITDVRYITVCKCLKSLGN